MLEYALKQERAKYHKLKFGTDPNQGEKKPELSEQVSNGPVESVTLENSPLVWKEGRQLLRQYLEEVGYTDTILDMRSKRVRSLLGRSLEINGTVEPSEGGPRATPGPGGLSGGESLLVKQIEEQIKRNAAGKDGKERLSGSVLEQIPFLQNCEDEDSDEDDELDSVQHKKQRVKVRVGAKGSAPPPPRGSPCFVYQEQGAPVDALRAPSVGCVASPHPRSLSPCLSHLQRSQVSTVRTASAPPAPCSLHPPLQLRGS
ncbi:striatin-4-like [Myotis lucifugus]|uniref:striatin-4-like n=1 Tax=Myotis lucifugus TaxID=59463 RepID=UPI0003C4B84C|nr:striatin-4-like [Myotis lucifugus]